MSPRAQDGQRENGFRGPQVCEIVGITYRQLDYWARTGLLRPSIAEAKGSGTQRLYSYRDLVELKVIKQLLDAGLSLRRARRAIDCLRGDVGADLSAASLVLGEASSVLARTGDDLVDLLRGGQGVLNVVPMGGVVAGVDAAIARLAPARSRRTASVPTRLPLGELAEAADALGSPRPAGRRPRGATAREATTATGTRLRSARRGAAERTSERGVPDRRGLDRGGEAAASSTGSTSSSGGPGAAPRPSGARRPKAVG